MLADASSATTLMTTLTKVANSMFVQKSCPYQHKRASCGFDPFISDMSS